MQNARKQPPALKMAYGFGAARALWTIVLFIAKAVFVVGIVSKFI